MIVPHLKQALRILYKRKQAVAGRGRNDILHIEAQEEHRNGKTVVIGSEKVAE